MQTNSEAKLLDRLEMTFSKPEGDQAKRFTYYDKKPSGIHEGGIYLDENGERWLLKTENPIYALKEVIASQLYRLIVGKEAVMTPIY